MRSIRSEQNDDSTERSVSPPKPTEPRTHNFEMQSENSDEKHPPIKSHHSNLDSLTDLAPIDPPSGINNKRVSNSRSDQYQTASNGPSVPTPGQQELAREQEEGETQFDNNLM
jgi:hypothetical protein